MKRILTFSELFLIISLITSARTYYVSPTGSDSNTGTFSQPWKTWHYAFNHTTPSDTCYFRGGVYSPYSSSIGADLKTTTINGTRTHPTCFFAYPADFATGNYPILDCQTMMTDAFNYGIEISRCSNIYFKGLTLRNVKQTEPGVANATGWKIWSEGSTTQYAPNNLKFENCVAHNISGAGFAGAVYDTIYFINCDAFNCVDTLNTSDPGGHGNGFSTNPRANTYVNSDNTYAYFYGCRAWSCSDQGWALTQNGRTICDHCWSINNGNTPFSIVYDGVTYTNIATKGSGWKLWYATSTYKNSDVVQNTIHNCIAAYNAHIGINWTDINNEGSHPEIRAHIYNNFIYANIYAVQYKGTPWGYGVADAANIDTVGSWDHRWHNNVSYYNVERRDFLNGIRSGSSNNFFDVTGTPVNATWFQSLDTTGMMGIHEREADWSLPVTNFGKPAPGSPLVDAGIPVGLDYNGSAPDIGWFESSSGSPVSVPVYSGSVIENATPSRLEITYNLTLANIVPAASAFTIMVNSSSRSVSSVAVSGTKVLLTLSSPIVYGDVVTVAYTKPASNPLQTSSGGQAASLTAQSVTNIVRPVSPVYVSSVIENATPSRLEITYDLTLANIVPATSAFTVMVNSFSRSVSSVAISGTKVLLTLSSPVVYGNVVTVAYTKPASNPLQTSSGGQVASISAQSVTNNVAPFSPVYVSSVIENATPSRIEMTYNLTLANIVPAASAFSVMVNSSDRSISSVTISGTKVLLTLSSPVVYDDLVTVAYTKPSANPLQTSTGSQAASISAQPVTNNCRLSSNQPPVADILTPAKSSTFTAPATIILDVNAYDPDGTITKVEFFNSGNKLGEVTSPPYSFTWKDVPEGTYIITVTALDNLGAKSVSSGVTVVVTNVVTSVNQLPFVSISSPENNSSIVVPLTVTLMADASDPDGTISEVEYYIGTEKIGKSNVYPYSVQFECTKAGIYEIIAFARDNLNAVSVSSSVTFIAKTHNDPEVITLYPNPTDGQFTISLESSPLGEENIVSVVNLEGKTIYKDLLLKDEYTKLYDLSYLNAGVYIIMISNNHIAFTKKFIIK